MEEEVKYNAKNIDVNNSDSMFVTGVLYGLIHAIEMIREGRITGCEGNGIAKLINTALDTSWGQLYESFDLVRKNGRVPNFSAMLEQMKGLDVYKKNREKEREELNKLWDTINENKRVR